RHSLPHPSFYTQRLALPPTSPLSLHDALPISLSHQLENHGEATSRPRGFDAVVRRVLRQVRRLRAVCEERGKAFAQIQYAGASRSEEHTSELQSLAYLVCRLLLEKKNSKTDSY